MIINPQPLTLAARCLPPPLPPPPPPLPPATMRGWLRLEEPCAAPLACRAHSARAQLASPIRSPWWSGQMSTGVRNERCTVEHTKKHCAEVAGCAEARAHALHARAHPPSVPLPCEPAQPGDCAGASLGEMAPAHTLTPHPWHGTDAGGRAHCPHTESHLGNRQRAASTVPMGKCRRSRAPLGSRLMGLNWRGGHACARLANPRDGRAPAAD